MNEVWVVFYKEDNCICRVFAERQDANEYIDMRTDDFYIECWEVQ